MDLLLHAQGIESGTALRLRKRDVILEQRVIRAPGSKNANRDALRVCALSAGTPLPVMSETCIPDALLFDGMSYELARRAHVAVVRATNLPADYTLNSSRHSFAVQQLQDGVPAAFIAQNLGHRDSTMVTTVYGRYSPADEWARWQGNIARRDAAKRGSLSAQK